MNWFNQSNLPSIITTDFKQIAHLFQPDPALVEIFEKYYDKKLLIISKAISHYDYVITPNAPYEFVCYTISA